MPAPIPAVQWSERRSHTRFISSTTPQTPTPSVTLPFIPALGERKPKLLDQVRDAIRTRHYSWRTEQTYIQWIKRFIFFHDKKHPLAMGEQEVTQFLSALAVEKHVSASTQSQALSALLFLYRDVLKQELPWLQDVVRAKRPQRLPVVLSRAEVRDLLNHLQGEKWLMATLLYGTGLRLMECLRLRVKDVDFARNQITVREGKGNKDRLTMLPTAVKELLARHLAHVPEQHERDLANGFGCVALPDALERKYLNANREWGWQWVFPATQISVDPRSRVQRRHHLHESVLHRAIKEATRRAKIAKPVSCHTSRIVST
jgi:integron integrase